MKAPRILSSCMLVFALAACGEREFEPVVAAEEGFEPLPAPLPAAGAVTAPAGGEAAAGGLLGPAPTPADALPPGSLAVITPVPAQGAATMATDGTLLVMDPAAEGGQVAAIGFSDGRLPPLEDNPEAGLGAAAMAAGPATAAVAAPGTALPPAPARAADVRASATAAPSEQGAVAAVQGYFDALRAGDVRRAYATWSDGGRASGRSPEQFAAGVQGQAIHAVSLGEPARRAGANGAGHVEVPVTVTSRGADGREVRQVGSFVMRASDTGGARAAWHIASAELRELQP